MKNTEIILYKKDINSFYIRKNSIVEKTVVSYLFKNNKNFYRFGIVRFGPPVFTKIRKRKKIKTTINILWKEYNAMFSNFWFKYKKLLEFQFSNLLNIKNRTFKWYLKLNKISHKILLRYFKENFTRIFIPWYWQKHKEFTKIDIKKAKKRYKIYVNKYSDFFKTNYFALFFKPLKLKKNKKIVFSEKNHNSKKIIKWEKSLKKILNLNFFNKKIFFNFNSLIYIIVCYLKRFKFFNLNEKKNLFSEYRGYFRHKSNLFFKKSSDIKNWTFLNFIFKFIKYNKYSKKLFKILNLTSVYKVKRFLFTGVTLNDRYYVFLKFFEYLLKNKFDDGAIENRGNTLDSIRKRFKFVFQKGVIRMREYTDNFASGRRSIKFFNNVRYIEKIKSINYLSSFRRIVILSKIAKSFNLNNFFFKNLIVNNKLFFKNFINFLLTIIKQNRDVLDHILSTRYATFFKMDVVGYLTREKLKKLYPKIESNSKLTRKMIKKFNFSVYLNKFLNFFVKNGKKKLIKKILIKIITILKYKNNSINIMLFFKKLFYRLRPILFFKKYHLGKNLNNVPFFANDKITNNWDANRRFSKIAVFWMVRAIQARKEKTLVLRIVCELNDIIDNKGLTIEAKKNYYMNFYNTRSYTRLLKFVTWI